mmetsp:Transcript_14524/g.26054  ORF Transcript_14524/g.26054 Transcript_14524/m.26054 type:complete len:309 (+) Transcript_14524:104-1030(+)
MSRVVIATAGYEQEIQLWEAKKEKPIRSMKFDASQVNCLALSMDKLKLAAGGNQVVRLYETSTNNTKPIAEFKGHKSNVTSVGFRKDGRWLFSASEDGSIKIWDHRTANAQLQYQGKAAINCAVLHPNQAQIFAADQAGNVIVWDLIADKCIAQCRPVADDVSMRSVSISPNGSLLAACNTTGHCFLWKMDSPQTCTRLGEFTVKRLHETYILKCVISPDGKTLATASADRTVKIWSLPELTLDRVLGDHKKWVHDICFCADSTFLLSASSDGKARLWDLATGHKIKQYDGRHQKAIVAVALNDSDMD